MGKTFDGNQNVWIKKSVLIHYGCMLFYAWMLENLVVNAKYIKEQLLSLFLESFWIVDVWISNEGNAPL